MVTHILFGRVDTLRQCQILQIDEIHPQFRVIGSYDNWIPNQVIMNSLVFTISCL